MIDLRSDTVTKPTPAMREAMVAAEVGDDVFGEDPSVNALESYCATLFGKERALFCPSGTMTNQIGINILTQPYEEVICYKGSHIYLYEGGGIAGNSGLSFKLLEAERGILTKDAVMGAINPDDIHFPRTAVVALENTVNKGGGSCYAFDRLKEITDAAKAAGLRTHLDGARLCNAIVAKNEDPEAYGDCFDTISLCLSKGLGAPVGSVLIASETLIKRARRMRKVFGGGMRQAGYLAAAGLYALRNHVDRLEEDHRRARELGDRLSRLDYVDHVLPVDTNIIIYELNDRIDPLVYLNSLKGKGLLAVHFGGQQIRLVTHLEITDDLLEQASRILQNA